MRTAPTLALLALLVGCNTDQPQPSPDLMVVADLARTPDLVPAPDLAPAPICSTFTDESGTVVKADSRLTINWVEGVDGTPSGSVSPASNQPVGKMVLVAALNEGVCQMPWLDSFSFELHAIGFNPGPYWVYANSLTSTPIATGQAVNGVNRVVVNPGSLSVNRPLVLIVAMDTSQATVNNSLVVRIVGPLCWTSDISGKKYCTSDGLPLPPKTMAY